MNRILVIRGGAIGDFVLTLPAIKLLREHFPEARLEIVGYPHIAALAEGRFYAQAVRSIEAGALARFFARQAELPAEWADYFQSFDLVVSYLFDPDQIFERNLRRCGVENFLAVSPKITGHEHAAQQLARPLETLGLRLTNPRAELFPSGEDRDFARRFLAPNESRMIAIHPGSGSRTKNWPIAKWLKVVNAGLALSGASVLVITGESERAELPILRRTLPATTRFADCLRLPQLAAVIERCALFLGHDSGISHIAAAVKTRAILLFGPSDPAIWAPAGEHVRVLRAPNEEMENLTVREVEQALCAAWSATPQEDVSS